MHHAVAVARQSDRKTGRPLEHGPSLVLAWGRGSEGQLGARGHEDSAAPLVVDALKGRTVLGVACGGCNTLAVCENDPRRFESDCREEAEAAQRALAGVAEGRPPTAPGLSGRSSRGPSQQHAGVATSGGSSLSDMVRRTFSGTATHPAPHPVPPSSNGSLHGGSVAALGPWPTGPGSLARMSSSSVRSASGRAAHGQPQTSVQLYAALTSASTGQRAPPRTSAQPRSLRGRPSSERGLSNGGGDAMHVGSGGLGRLVSLSPGGPSQHQSTLRRSLLASRSFTAHSHLSHASELSSLSSQPRPLSDDGCEVESYCGGGALTSAELAAIDEIRSNSSVATLQVCITGGLGEPWRSGVACNQLCLSDLPLLPTVPTWPAPLRLCRRSWARRTA